MALKKNAINLNFAKGIDTKSDPLQLQLGSMSMLQNGVFNKGGALQKRNGFGRLTSLPSVDFNYLSTFNGNLTAIGDTLSAFSDGSDTWVNKGDLQPVELSAMPVYRSSTNQPYADSAVASNGLVCTAFTDVNCAVSTYKYLITDSITGQNIVNAVTLVPTAGTVEGPARVFLLGRFFILVFPVLITASYHLQYIAVSINTPTSANAAVDFTSQYEPSSSNVAFDGVVANNTLVVAFNGSDVGGAIRLRALSQTLTLSSAIAFATQEGTMLSVCSDETGVSPIVYVAYYQDTTDDASILAVDTQLSTILAPTAFITNEIVLNMAPAAQDGVCTIMYEIDNTYSYNSLPTNYIKKNTVTQAGTVGSSSVVLRSIGLASKAFIVEGTIYVLAAYDSVFQPTYFLIDSVSNVIAKLAYSNGGGYTVAGLPSVTVDEVVAKIAYLYKGLIAPVNKIQGAANAAGVYSQTGVNLATFDLSGDNIISAEIAESLNLTGGFLWMYDGVKPVEHGFHVWPDDVGTTVTASGGAMGAQDYYYVAIYEWTDASGNIHRSAPSIPVIAEVVAGGAVTTQSVFTSGVSSITVSSTTGLQVGQVLTDTTTGGNIQAGTYITSIVGMVIGLSLPTAGASAGSPGDTLSTITTSSVVINVPTLRLTYKIANPVRIVVYRSSVAQPTYYQITSITCPTLNNTAVDSVAVADTFSDSVILGNSILYTTGGVIENIAAPAVSSLTLYKSRLWGLVSENLNLLWYSKQVIQNTPVEMTDGFTYYVASTTAAQGFTGPMRALSAMDDKLIIFKRSAIYYTVGTGPNNLGTDNDLSEPTFITSTVGCTNQKSIVFMPQGLMFQSDKGIWLLGRDLSTSYIGAPVEDFNEFEVLSAVNVPGSNQVRFALSNGVTLMYDYYYGQWGTFTGVPAISSTLYQELHTYIDQYGRVSQETPGVYKDGSLPVLLSFKTGWLNLAGLQGLERAYYFYLLGTYYSPHKLSVGISYDYNDNPSQQSVISPDNFGGTWGSEQLWGSAGPWGGPGNVEQWRVFLQQQKCQSFMINVQEQYDASLGAMPGAGVTFSGLDLVVGVKKGMPTLKGARSVG